MKNVELSKLLASIEKATGIRIRVTGEFGRDDSKTLAERHTLRLGKAPFCKAFVTLQKVTGLNFEKLQDGAVVLTKEPFFGRKRRPAGPGSITSTRGYPAPR